MKRKRIVIGHELAKQISREIYRRSYVPNPRPDHLHAFNRLHGYPAMSYQTMPTSQELSDHYAWVALYRMLREGIQTLKAVREVRGFHHYAEPRDVDMVASLELLISKARKLVSGADHWQGPYRCRAERLCYADDARVLSQELANRIETVDSILWRVEGDIFDAEHSSYNDLCGFGV